MVTEKNKSEKEINKQPQWLDAVIPIFVIAYAVWTLYVHLLTAVHANFLFLVRGMPAVLVVVLAFLWIAYKRPPAAEWPTTENIVPATSSNSSFGALYVFLASATWVFALTITGSYYIFWWGSILALTIFWCRHFKPTPSLFYRKAPDKHSSQVVAAVAAAAVIATLLAKRPDSDDSFYLSIPATLLRWPDQPILLKDTIYRIADLPLQLPVYRLHSYEVLIGLLARLTHVQPAYVAYFFMPALFSALSVVAWAQLLRFLAPTQWKPTLFILFVCVLSLGEAHHAYGNFAFVRMFQGKAILATFMVPSIIYYAIAFSNKSTLRNWLLLFAAQIAAIGITSSALFVAPLTAGLTLAGTWSPNAVATRRLALGLLASSYVFAAAAVMALLTHGGGGFVSSNAMPPVLPWFEQTMGIRSTPLLMVVLLSSWAFVEERAQKKLLLGSSLFFLVIVLNPYAYQFFADHLTGTSTYWRLFWALPLPFMLAIMLHRMWSLASRLRPNFLTLGARALMVTLTALFAFNAGSLRASNGVTIGLPTLKVPSPDYYFAKFLASNLSESEVLLAPESVTAWLPTFSKHPTLLSARAIYTVGAFGQEDGTRRNSLQLYVAGIKPMQDGPMQIQRAIHDYALSAVVAVRSSPWENEIVGFLSTQGWRCQAKGIYDLCKR
jgi:hypothetical protein